MSVVVMQGFQHNAMKCLGSTNCRRIWRSGCFTILYSRPCSVNNFSHSRFISVISGWLVWMWLAGAFWLKASHTSQIHGSLFWAAWSSDGLKIGNWSATTAAGWQKALGNTWAPICSITHRGGWFCCVLPDTVWQRAWTPENGISCYSFSGVMWLCGHQDNLPGRYFKLKL